MKAERQADGDQSRLVKLETDVKYLSTSFEDYSKQINSRLSSLEVSIKEMSDGFNRREKVNWPLIVSIIVGGVIIISNLHGFLAGPINQRIGFLEKEAADKVLDLKRIESQVIANRNSAEQVSEKLKEIETQFVATSHIRNLQVQKTELRVAMIWQRVAPSEQFPWPDDDYYPIMGSYKN